MIEFQIGGKVRKFYFGLECLGEVFQRLDVDITTIGNYLQKNPYKATPALLYEAHKSAVEYDEKMVDFTYRDVCKWIDEVDGGINNKDIEDCFKAFLKTIKNHLPKTEGGDSKKK